MSNQLNEQSLKDSIKFLESWLEFNFKDSRLLGLQVAIRHKDKLVLSKAYGVASVETGEQLTTNHQFRVASQSKPFAATAIMMLAEQGTLSVDDKVSQHLRWFRSKKDPRIAELTIKQLLKHNSGLSRDLDDADYWQGLRDFPTEDEIKEYIQDAMLTIDPNTDFKYSNFAYTILGMLITEVSAMPFATYVEENIIKPLDLKHTLTDFFEQPELAIGHTADLFFAERKPYPKINTQIMTSAGGFCSTAEDLTLFLSQQLAGKNDLLSEESKQTMQKATLSIERSSDQYGQGLFSVELDGHVWHGHGGRFPGFRTDTQFNKEFELVVSVFINAVDIGPSTIRNPIIKILTFFQDHGHDSNVPVSNPDIFTGRFASNNYVGEIARINNSFVGFESRYWNDFSSADFLQYKDDTTLTIASAAGTNAVGQDVIFTFNDDGSVKYVRYAGVTMKPWTMPDGS